MNVARTYEESLRELRERGRGAPPGGSARMNVARTYEEGGREGWSETARK